MSKWDEAELEKHAGYEQVDVTLKLVDAFPPSERARKNAMEIQKLKPVPIEKTKH